MRTKLFICLLLTTVFLLFAGKGVEARSVTTELLILPLQCSLEVVDDGVQQTASYSPDECNQIADILDPKILPIDNPYNTNEPATVSDLTFDKNASSISTILEAIKSLMSKLASLFASNKALGSLGIFMAVLGFIAVIIYRLI
jgi:hypothetical protein